MTQEEILKGNKLIATFMNGFLIKDSSNLDDDKGRKYWQFPGAVIWSQDEFKYHYSFDWLMQVVEKIEKTKANCYDAFSVRIIRKFCSIEGHENGKSDGLIYQTPFRQEHNSKIETVWQAVIGFIKYYNAQPPQPINQ